MHLTASTAAAAGGAVLLPPGKIKQGLRVCPICEAQRVEPDQVAPAAVGRWRRIVFWCLRSHQSLKIGLGAGAGAGQTLVHRIAACNQLLSGNTVRQQHAELLEHGLRIAGSQHALCRL